MEPTFHIKSKLWVWKEDNAGSWHFITINPKTSISIAALAEGPRRGFGAVKVLATIGRTSWKTSIFPTKDKTYFLPIKLSVRKAENLHAEHMVPVTLTLI